MCGFHRERRHCDRRFWGKPLHLGKRSGLGKEGGKAHWAKSEQMAEGEGPGLGSRSQILLAECSGACPPLSCLVLVPCRILRLVTAAFVLQEATGFATPCQVPMKVASLACVCCGTGPSSQEGVGTGGLCCGDGIIRSCRRMRYKGNHRGDSSPSQPLLFLGGEGWEEVWGLHATCGIDPFGSDESPGMEERISPVTSD